MYSNEFSANEKHYKRSITITDDNEVIISEFSSNIDCERDTLQTETKKKYQSVAILKLGVKLTLNPPYPYNIVGFVPSSFNPIL